MISKGWRPVKISGAEQDEVEEIKKDPNQKCSAWDHDLGNFFL